MKSRGSQGGFIRPWLNQRKQMDMCEQPQVLSPHGQQHLVVPIPLSSVWDQVASPHFPWLQQPWLGEGAPPNLQKQNLFSFSLFSIYPAPLTFT